MMWLGTGEGSVHNNQKKGWWSFDQKAAAEKMTGREDLNDRTEIKWQDLVMDWLWEEMDKDWKVNCSLVKPNYP